MQNLIVPMMGKSTRFPNLRPKWMLTHPFGNFMVVEGLRGLPLEDFDVVYFVVSTEHQREYAFEAALREQVKQLCSTIKIEFVYLDKETGSQPETVYTAIQLKKISGPILIKDSDNFFRVQLHDTLNYVCYSDLNDATPLNARNKSYIQFDVNKYVSNIVEKKIISSTFSVGGYGFESAETFCSYYERLANYGSELYTSHIIFEMLLDKHKFSGLRTTDYEDWGTLEDWNRYKKTFKTLFIDLDGTLLTNTSPTTKPLMGTGQPLHENISRLQKLYSTGRVKIIITTARPVNYKLVTEYELRQHQIPYDELLMGLPHSERVIINDFADSNPYPSCSAINLKRNSDGLKEYL